MEVTLDFAKYLDAEDVLSSFRQQFKIPTHHQKEAIYFLGNSLGLQPVRTEAYLHNILRQWHHWGVEAFFMGDDPWLDYHDHLVNPLSLIVGALPHEVVVMNQLTVNLHLLLATFYRPAESRRKILCEAKAFPSDQYMLETHIRQRGLDPDDILIEVAPPAGKVCIDPQQIINVINENKDELALVFLGGVNYYTGQVFPMEQVTRAAHSVGALAGFDLAHAAGNINLQLHNWNVDFAAWCSYKYLNSGPGAIAGAYIHERYHTDDGLPRLGGWWGYRKDRRFLMQKGFDPTPSAEGWQLSTPSPLLYAAHRAALEIFSEAGMDRILNKGRALSDYLLFLLEHINSQFAVPPIQILTPGNSAEKGCQVSLLIPEKGRAVFDELTRNHIFADWREPDVIRVAPVPLYNTFEEIWHFASILLAAIKNNG